MSRCPRRPIVRLELPPGLKVLMGSVSLLFGMTLAVVAAVFLIEVFEPVGAVLHLPLNSILDFKTAAILIAGGGIWFALEIYSFANRWLDRHT